MFIQKYIKVQKPFEDPSFKEQNLWKSDANIGFNFRNYRLEDHTNCYCQLQKQPISILNKEFCKIKTFFLYLCSSTLFNDMGEHKQATDNKCIYNNFSRIV